MKKIFYYVATENFITDEQFRDEYECFGDGMSYKEYYRWNRDDGCLQTVDEHFRWLIALVKESIENELLTDGNESQTDLEILRMQISDYMKLAEMNPNERYQFEQKIRRYWKS